MQIRLRNVLLDKPPVSESTFILLSSTYFFNDEANFHVTGYVNKQNMHCFWAQAQLHENQYHPLSVEKVTVCCALGRTGIILPYRFEDADECRVTVNTELYIELIKWKFIPAMRRKGEVDMDVMIYQQDGAKPHCSRTSLKYNHLLLSWRAGSSPRRTDHLWPAHSPNLHLFWLFLWGYLKDRVYANIPQTDDALKNNIRADFRRIPMSCWTGSLQTSLCE